VIPRVSRLNMVEQRGDGPSDVEFYQLSSALVAECGGRYGKKAQVAVLLISSLTLM
jgi:hypothetical protein